MFSVLCINNKPIRHSNGIESTGQGLKEGAVYTVADDIVYIHPNNKKECYLISELGDLKLITRFVRLGDVDETELIRLEEESIH